MEEDRGLGVTAKKYLGPWYAAHFGTNNIPYQYHRDDACGAVRIIVWHDKSYGWLIDGNVWSNTSRGARPFGYTAHEAKKATDELLLSLGYEFLDEERFEKLKVLI